MKCSKEKEIRNVFDNFFVLSHVKTHTWPNGHRTIVPKSIVCSYQKNKKRYCCLLCFEMRLDSTTFVQQVVISSLCTFVFMISNLTITGQSHHVLDNGFAYWSKW